MLRGKPERPAHAGALVGSSVKVLAFANLKGGVGKTTIAENIGAYFAVRRRKRVLYIDMDYQGSLTGVLIRAAKSTLTHTPQVVDLVGQKNSGQQKWTDIGKAVPGAALVTGGQLFDSIENRVMMQWLIGDIEDDVRLRLAKMILSDKLQANVDVVIVDAPPRLSLGAINGLCAAHAVIVPTILDGMSVDSVGRFLSRADEFQVLAPALQHAIVVPSLTQETGLRRDEELALAEAKASLGNWKRNAAVAENRIRHFPTLAKVAGDEVAYMKDKRWVRPAFDALGDEIARIVGI